MKKKQVMAVFLTAGMLLDLLSPCAYAAPADTQDEAAFFEELEANAEEIVVSYEEETDVKSEAEEKSVDRKSLDDELSDEELIEDTEDVSVADEVSEENVVTDEVDVLGDKAVIARFDFENLTEANADITGEGAKATGTYSITEDLTGKGKALSLNVKNGAYNAQQQFISITGSDGKSLMTGLDEFTITYEQKQINTSSANWPIFLNRDADSPEGKQNYIGTFLNASGQLNLERYYNNNRADQATTPSVSVPTNEWAHVTLVEKNGFAAIYVNGKLKGSKSFDEDLFKVSDILGTSSIFNVGKATWGGGEYYGGYIDNLTVYNYAFDTADAKDEYDDFKDAINQGGTADTDSPDIGFVYRDFTLPETIGDVAVDEWMSDKACIDVVDCEAQVDRSGLAENTEVTLTAYDEDDTLLGTYKAVVVADGGYVASYTISDPIEGQAGGMVLATRDEDDYEVIHGNQPVMYTAKGNKAFDVPVIFRTVSGNSFGMVASDAGSANIMIYDSEDLISYTNERYVSLEGVSGINFMDMIYDFNDERYELFVEDGIGRQYLFTSKDLKTFKAEGLYPHTFVPASGAPEDSVYASEIGVTQSEYDTLMAKFTNPSAEGIAGRDTLTKTITVDKGDDLRAALDEIAKDESVTIDYSNGDSHTYGVHFNQDDVEMISTSAAGEYTLRAYIGGDSYVIDADDPLIAERADPFITYDEETGYYYFTASYPMYGNDDPDGYDRLVLRRAKTVTALADADEITIWDENSDPDLGRFIWAPEIHKINGKWYFIATAGKNKGTGTTFDIRPFMIRFDGDITKDEDFINPAKWGKPELVKAYQNDNILAGMSLDMTYFEAKGKHYLVWPDETKNTTNPDGLSYIYIAETDPDNPTQLKSKAKLLTKPEFSWELVRYKVNEGPAVIKKDGKVYVAFSAAGTGSEYCVGYVCADEDADLMDMDNWTKNPYPILTSGDFDNKLSGPGHNSFTVNANNEPIIVFHARPAYTHAHAGGLHSGDPLYDPCRSAYIRPVFFDSQGVPVLNLSDREFAGEDGSAYEIKVIVQNDGFNREPILEYTFDEKLSGNKVKNTTPSGNKLDGTLYGKGVYLQDKEYGQVLYLDGEKKNFGGNNSYLEFPKGFFDGRNNLTISMDVNEVTRNGNYMTFAMGQDDTKYMFYKIAPTQMKAAITTGGSGREKSAIQSATYPNNVRDWVNIKIALTNNMISIYRNGELFARTARTGTAVEDLGEGLTAYLGKSFYSADQYFRGYFDNVRVYEYAMNEIEARRVYAADEAARKEMLSQVDRVAELFAIPDSDKIMGNITLPDEIDGVKIAWTSSAPGIISDKAVKVAGYDDMPAGVVKRGDSDKKVTLTAVFSKQGQESVTKDYEVTVKAAPAEIDEYKGYLFAGFRDAEQDYTKEQVYFSFSRDGFNWFNLNDNKPVLYSNLGEGGTRDQFIGRSAEGDRFFLIGTDLSINNNKVNGGADWGGAGGSGSLSIIVWESTDLVNWSEPRIVEIAPWLDENDKPGCTWAPEFYYDDKTGEYVVFFSCTHLEVDDDGNITQGYENHSVYYCKTRDFYTFTEGKPFIKETETYSGGERMKRIDTTMIRDGDKYYRYTKKERPGRPDGGEIYIETADAILGEWTEIPSPSLKAAKNTYGELEGPSIYKLNEKDENGNDQWCLLIDRFARGLGYQPFITTDLSSGEFRGLADTEYSMPGVYRHGSAMPITLKEYNALNAKWGGSIEVDEVAELKKSSGNPMLGFDEKGKILYGGDPSILVDGDTVYAYVGQDTATGESYNMPDWKCYSSKDMVNWTYESTILTCDRKNVTWAYDDISAWAGQVVRYKDKYYFYFCTETTSAYGGGKSIGVAVSDSPKGPFKDIGHPLVRNIDTDSGVSTWEDIDPTFWIDTDEDGVEHRVLGWGNTRFFNCELNEDMISVKDKDKDAEKISAKKASEKADADIKVGVINGMGDHTFTEAPYYYRQQDEDGNYVGKYYMFFACDWREQMAYAYADTFEDFINNEWTFGGVLMEPSATANTNHMAVFDFKGHTYFVYHDGSLSHGSGFRRVACVEEIEINADGSIDYIRKTATGISGTLSSITDAKGNYIAAKSFENTLNDDDYPFRNKGLISDYYKNGYEAGWEINPGKVYGQYGEYVSIESDYKPGLYISAGVYGRTYSTGDTDTIPAVLAQDAGGTGEEKQRMTFRTLKGENGGVIFESVYYPGFCLMNRDGALLLAKPDSLSSAEFYVEDRDTKRNTTKVQKTKRMYTQGQTLNTDDIRIMVKENGIIEKVDADETNAADIDMATPGVKVLMVKYTYEGETYEKSVRLYVAESAYGR